MQDRDSTALKVQNGLAGMIGGLGTGGQGIGGGFNYNALPWGQGSAYTNPTSNPATMFLDLRWFLVSNWRQFLSEAYVEIGLIQTICRVPVEDGLRGGIEIKSKQLDEHQIEELQISVDRDDDMTTVCDAGTWNRLFGGAGILILTDQDPTQPLELAQIRPDEALEFRAVDMWELFWDKQLTEGYDPAIQSQNFEYYNYYGMQVHKSRVMRLKGMTAPSFIRPRLRGWGFSVVEALVRSMNQYLKATDLGFQVLDEFKLDVYSIQGLNDTLLMGQEGENQVRQRIMLANYLKNYLNALVMDKEDSYDHKQLSFAGLGEAMQGIRMQVACDMRMPMLKLFGTPATGLGASDEESMEVYNSMVESEVRNKLKYPILRMLEIKCQQKFGFVPDDLSVSFKPLRTLTSEQEENVKTQKMARLVQCQALAQVDDSQFKEAVNKGNLLDIKLVTGSDMNPDMDDEVMEGDADPYSVKADSDDPGSSRVDSRRVTAGNINKEPPAPKSADAPDVKAKPETAGAGPRGVGTMDESRPVRGAAKATKLPMSKGSPNELDSPDEEGDIAVKGKVVSMKGHKARNATSVMRMENVGNYILPMPSPWSFRTRIERIWLVNSPEFDRRSYEADGGDNWIDPRRREFFENPGNVDEGLWAKAKDRSMEVYGTVKWQFVTYLYKRLGGKFS